MPRISPQTAAGTVFNYALDVNPVPVTASSADSSEPQTVWLLLTVTNPSETTAQGFNSITLQIPSGTGSGDLTNTTPSGTCVSSDSTDFNASVAASTFQSQPTVALTITPATSSSQIAKGGSYWVQLPEIDINDMSGVVSVTVVEDAANGFIDVPFQIVKVPFGFYFENLLATYGGNPVAQVANGNAVLLTWDASAVGDATIDVYYSANGQPPSALTSTTNGSCTSNALVTNTVFTVVATVASSIVLTPNGTNQFVLSTAVAVTSPTLVAGSLSVGTTSIMYADANNIACAGAIEAASVSAPSITAETSLTAYNTTIGTSSYPAPLTVNGALTQSGDNATFGTSSAIETVTIYGPLNQSAGSVTFGTPSKNETLVVYRNIIAGQSMPANPSSFDGLLFYRPMNVGGQNNPYPTQLLGDVTLGLADSTITADGTFSATNAVTLGAYGTTVTVNGDLTAAGAVTATGDVTLGSSGNKVTVDGNLQVNGTVYAGTVILKYTSGGLTTTARLVGQYLKIYDPGYNGSYSKMVAGAVIVNGTELSSADAALVSYRGCGRLTSGRTTIELPTDFDTTVEIDSVTVHLTPVDGFDPICVVTEDGRKVAGGKFTVASDNAASIQKFDWEVKARRAKRVAKRQPFSN